jgi:hypothetical protein
LFLLFVDVNHDGSVTPDFSIILWFRNREDLGRLERLLAGAIFTTNQTTVSRNKDEQTEEGRSHNAPSHNVKGVEIRQLAET